MIDLGTIFLFLMALQGEQGGGGGGGGAPPAPGPTPGPAPSPSWPFPVPPIRPIRPAPGPTPPPGPVRPIRPVPPPTPPVPQGLPPFPGPGWTACATTPDIVARASYWNPILWNFATKTIVKAYQQEMLGGRWVTFKAAWHPGDNGPQTFMATEAYCLSAPGPTPPQPGPAPTGKPGPVGPEPELGGWQTDRAFVKRYQAALSFLSFTMNRPEWNTSGVDGKFGPHTKAAVMAFQSAHGLTTDGEVGSGTASAIDTVLGYPVPPGGYPPPGGGGGGGGGLPSSNPDGSGGGGNVPG